MLTTIIHQLAGIVALLASALCFITPYYEPVPDQGRLLTIASAVGFASGLWLIGAI